MSLFYFSLLEMGFEFNISLFVWFVVMFGKFAEALQLVVKECKPKAKIVDICEKGDAFIRE